MLPSSLLLTRLSPEASRAPWGCCFKFVAHNIDGLNRVSNKLEGNIPKELAKLQAPNKLSLNGNPLGGVIPRELRGCQRDAGGCKVLA